MVFTTDGEPQQGLTDQRNEYVLDQVVEGMYWMWQLWGLGFMHWHRFLGHCCSRLGHACCVSSVNRLGLGNESN